MQHGLVTTEDFQSLGMSSSTVRDWCRSGRLVRMAPRVYLLPDLLGDWSHLGAACLSRPGAVASHRAAATLWGMDGIEIEVVEITVPSPCRPRSEVLHRSDDLAPFEVTTCQGIPCTDPTRTLVDLGAVVADDVVERALESALRLGITRITRLQWRLHALARSGRPGPASLRRVLQCRPGDAPPTESDLETLFLQCLRAAGVEQPVRQHRVPLPDGSDVRLDSAYPSVLAFIELDGWAAHRSRRAFNRDRSRQNQLVLLGWRPLRFTWSQVVQNPERVAAEVAAVLAAGAVA